MDLYIAAAVVAVLLVALVLCWMQPRPVKRGMVALPVRDMATGCMVPPLPPAPTMADQTFACAEHYYGPAGCPNCR